MTSVPVFLFVFFRTKTHWSGKDSHLWTSRKLRRRSSSPRGTFPGFSERKVKAWSDWKKKLALASPPPMVSANSACDALRCMFSLHRGTVPQETLAGFLPNSDLFNYIQFTHSVCWARAWFFLAVCKRSSQTQLKPWRAWPQPRSTVIRKILFG